MVALNSLCGLATLRNILVRVFRTPGDADTQNKQEAPRKPHRPPAYKILSASFAKIPRLSKKARDHSRAPETNIKHY